MLPFSVNELYGLIFLLLFLLSILYGKVNYLKGRLKELEDSSTQDSWRSEALFLRHQVNEKAAEFSEYN